MAYNLSQRNLEEMMAERGISVDHATIGRWVVRYSPEFLEQFNRRKRSVSCKWHVDETYIKVRGRWMYLCRAIDTNGDTVEFWFSGHRQVNWWLNPIGVYVRDETGSPPSLCPPPLPS